MQILDIFEIIERDPVVVPLTPYFNPNGGGDRI
jgi:hypothetical protein